MGVITDLTKQRVKLRYFEQAHPTDQSREIDPDGYGFTIIREDGFVLQYDGTVDAYVDHKIDHGDATVKTCREQLTETINKRCYSENEMYGMISKSLREKLIDSEDAKELRRINKRVNKW